MKKHNTGIIVLIISAIIAIVIGLAWYNLGPGFMSPKEVTDLAKEEHSAVPEEEKLTGLSNEETADDKLSKKAEEAEKAGFQFVLDFIEVGPPSMDEAAANRTYQALSSQAQTKVKQETLSRDLTTFVGVENTPDQGVSVENLVLAEDGSAILTIGLNYSTGGRILKAITLIEEDAEWKVDAVTQVKELE
jgi:hypothetical protein